MRIAVLLLVLLLPFGARGQSQRPAPVGEMVDKMVATVNGQLITYSDLLWQLALQPDTPLDDPRTQDLEATLELIIDQRLVAQEAEKLPHVHATDKEIEDTLAALIKRFPSVGQFQQRVGSVGLTAEQLREIVHR